VSITPGMLHDIGHDIRYDNWRKTRAFGWLLGELVGVGNRGYFCLRLVWRHYYWITLMYFIVLKYIGGAYLAFIGLQMWLSKGKMAIKADANDYQTRLNELT